MHDEVLKSVESYKREVKNGIFPSEKESFTLSQEEKNKLITK